MSDIFVINLEASVDRRDNIARQLNTLKLPFHIFPAVNGHKEQHPLFDLYDDQLSQQYRGKSLSRGQLGCYASHYLLWQKCVENDKPIIILEDDALIYSEPFMEFISILPTLDPSIECLRLFDNKRRAFSSWPIIEQKGLSIHKFTRGHMSTTGYYLTPNGAKKLLTHSTRWYMAVDIYMDRFWINQVECYGTVPACLTNDPKFDSEIGYGSKTKRSMYCRLKRETFNLFELCRREYHNTCFRIGMHKKK
ncbi:glycosyltransferase family 25 protein [Photobacterium aphoticum]|uniref:Epitope biosynthesis protein n=1 Tax=Photobacterium aphoticum TaxID=754436 RepID=A0A0J1GIY3_9GAMM|nr:glycosyltransferase family 25 protein [Photobacterium aphoticum]KLU99672.1 epitope biosynthesis protein [Photobacterium aphoticum]PSU55282.1 epitope biosynthesis protein [Photobacterium aphoticum]GHA43903.1 hypothetical protein GCM10007086_16970 [Photobacterium aphoticum]